MEKRLIELGEKLNKLNKEEVIDFIRWVVNMFEINEYSEKTIEEKFIKEEKEMGNLAKIGREIYEDGFEKGIEKGKIISIKTLLCKKLKEENEEVSKLLNKVPIEKIEEIEEKIFEITSWEEVEKILKN